MAKATLIGLIGLMCLVLSILFFCGKTLGQFRGVSKDIEATFNKKVCTRFWGFLCLAIAISYLLGTIFIVYDIFPMAVRIFLYTPLVFPPSTFYLNKSRRFRSQY